MMIIDLPYNGIFSRSIIFAFFADWHRTSKMKLREILEYRIDANGIDPIDPWPAKIVSAKFFKTPISENCAPRKFGTVGYRRTGRVLNASM